MSLLRAILTTTLLVANISLWGFVILVLGVGRLIPFSRHAVIRLIEGVVETWAAWNERILAFVHPGLEWRINIDGDLRTDRNYLVVSNHISWLDVLAVQRALIGRIPFLRFFLKDELRWAPIVGYVAWSLEMPFVKRYSAEYLEKHPEKRGRDLETTRHATRRFGERASSILSYVEGTRFTEEKHLAQENRWKWLLTPKLGGISWVLGAVGDRVHTLVDVTVSYPARRWIFWKLLAGKLDWIAVDVREIAIPTELKTGEALESEELREQLRAWIHAIWNDKDALIERRMTEA